MWCIPSNIVHPLHGREDAKQQSCTGQGIVSQLPVISSHVVQQAGHAVLVVIR